MEATTETVEGHVIDVACIRKNPRDELLEKAQHHSKDCALMGHCIESGYGIVTDDDRVTLLDPGASRKIVDVVEESETQQGIRLRVTREEEEEEGTLETITVEEV